MFGYEDGQWLGALRELSRPAIAGDCWGLRDGVGDICPPLSAETETRHQAQAEA